MSGTSVEQTNGDVNRKSLFSKELNLINNPDIREFVGVVLDGLPEYFFHIPASSTGKYHPAYALGEGGLVRHVIAAVWIADELMRMEDYTQDEKDIVFASLILHDGLKNGNPNTGATLTEHPLLMSKFLHEQEPHNSEWKPEIISCIETHMGRWVNNFKTGQKVLEPPQSRLQKLVHLADYIASRRQLEFKFTA